MILNTHHVFKLHVKLGSFMSCFQQVFSPTHVPILPPARSPRGDEGPFWTRQLALGPEGRICPELQESLDAFGAERTFAGRKKKQIKLAYG